MSKIPLHGGDLVAASQRYGIAINEWIDLSTGLNPNAYPVGELTADVFSALPYLQFEFSQQVKSYYGQKDFLAVAGSQQIIQLLPDCLPAFSLLAPQYGYREYVDCWLRAGCELELYPSLCQREAQQAIDKALVIDGARHLLLINPNNPTGITFSTKKIMAWAQLLHRDAYLIVDEAFMDITPEQSLLAGELPDNVIVLRSFGKFFGLAGIRLGFVFCNHLMLKRFSQRCGLWSINGPAQAIAIKALADVAWQLKTRRWLSQANTVTQSLFAPLFNTLALRIVTAELFFSVILEKNSAVQIYEFFASRGLLLRLHQLNNQTHLLRIGLVNIDDPDLVEHIKTLVDDCKLNGL